MEALVTSTVFLGVIAVPLGLILLFVRGRRLWGPGLLVAGPLMVVVGLVTPASPRTPPTSLGTPGGQGSFGGHRYSYSLVGGTSTATFSPFLPRDDATVLGAIRDVVSRVYGEALGPTPAQASGQALLFRSERTTYRVILVKEDTGEVHSFFISREGL